MTNYVLNIVTITKASDAYDEVATNIYPIIIRTFSDDTLKERLLELKDKIKKTLKTKYLYEKSYFCIRSIEDDREMRWKIKDIVPIDY